MSDLDNAINSINASAAKAENTATFLDDMSTFDDQSSVTNPNNGQTVASIPKQVKDRTDELFTAAESDINQAVSDAAQSATDAQDAADSIGQYQGLWPDSGGSADKGDTYQTQVSGVPTGQYFTALQNTTVDPVGDDVNWRELVSTESFSQYTDVVYKASGVNSAVDNLLSSLNLNPLMYAIGTNIKTGATLWEYTSSTGPITEDNFRVFSGVYVGDFLVDGSADDYSGLKLAISTARLNKTSLFLSAGKTYNTSFALLIPDNISIEIIGRGNAVINKTTSNGLETPKSVTNKGVVYNLSQNAVMVYDTADSGASAEYTYNIKLKGISLTGDVNQDYAVYAPRCSYLEFEKCAMYMCTTGFWTHNTWKSQFEIAGNATTTNLVQFVNDGSGVGTGTSNDFDLWHKGNGNAIYAYGMTYSKINRVILEGIIAGNSSGSLGVIELASCRGFSIEQIGLEVCTLSSGALIRATGEDYMSIESADIAKLTLGASTYFMDLSGVTVDYKGRHSGCDDSAATYTCNITNGASLVTDTDGLVLPGWTKKCLVDIADDSYLKDRRTSRNFHRDGFDLAYSFVGNYRDFGNNFTTPPTFGVYWKNGDKLWQNDASRIGQPINDPLCWIQDGDGAPNFVAVYAGTI